MKIHRNKIQTVPNFHMVKKRQMDILCDGKCVADAARN